jgi:uncharacterized protein
VNSRGVVYESNPEQEKSTFPCFCCGICCSDYQVHLELSEAREIAEHLGVFLQKFLDDYADPRWPGTDTYLLQHKAEGCIFLTRESGSAIALCRIQTFKPAACRQWAAGPNQKECRRGLNRYWGLSIDDSGKIAGSPEKLQSFQTFLKTL